MMDTIRAEFRKLFTVRSTYILNLVTLILLGLVTVYASYKGAKTVNALTLNDSLTAVSSVSSIFVSISALLLMAHEYRYNTIMYSLTLSNSRTKFLASKFITVFIYVAVAGVIYTLLGLGGLVLGTHLAGHSLPHQDIVIWHYLLKSLFSCVAFGLIALLFAVLLRNLVAAVALLLLGPGPIEALIGLVLKHNTQYLPFTALNQVTASAQMVKQDGYLTPTKSALLVTFYLVVSWLIAWLLFLKRDAN